MATHNELGKWGEDMAAQYLAGLGYGIFDRNVRIGGYEIDIIAIKSDRIIFVEVKTRANDFEDPVDAVDDRRMRRMARAADLFIRSRKIDYDPQFDVITIVGTPGSSYKLEHYPDAFFPPLDAG